MIAGALGIVNILIHDEGGSPRVVLAAETNLPDRSIFPKDIIHFIAADLERQISTTKINKIIIIIIIINNNN
jgi:hypothetical protein